MKSRKVCSTKEGGEMPVSGAAGLPIWHGKNVAVASSIVAGGECGTGQNALGRRGSGES